MVSVKMRLMKFFCAVCCGAAFSLHAQVDTNKTQSVSLQQVIQMAVEHNLDVQVQRYVPMIDKYAVEAYYGVYDVYFNGYAKDSYYNRPGQVSAGVQNSPVQNDSQLFGAALGGPNGGNAITPWGLQYGLTSTLEDDAYHTSATRTTTVVTPTTTNTVTQFVGNFNQHVAFTGITLDQPLFKNFLMDISRYNIQIAKKNYQFDELGFRLQVMSVVSQTEQAYDELIYAFDKVKVEQQAVDLARQLVTENKRRVEVGTLAPLDEKQSESQLAGAQADLISAKAALETQQNTLKSLITDKFRELHDVQLIPSEHLLSVPEMFDIQQSWERGLKMRPDLAQAKVDMDRHQLTVRYQRNQVLPQVDLVGAYGRSGLKNDLNGSLDDIRQENYPSYMYGLTVSIPLSNKAARNNYKSAKAANEQAAVAYKRMEQMVLIQIENSIANAKNDFERIHATREAREFADDALQAEQKKLAVGKSTSFVVLQLQNNLTTARSAEIRALADYNEALAQLTQNEGYTLEKYHLSVKLQ